MWLGYTACSNRSISLPHKFLTLYGFENCTYFGNSIRRCGCRCCENPRRLRSVVAVSYQSSSAVFSRNVPLTEITVQRGTSSRKCYSVQVKRFSWRYVRQEPADRWRIHGAGVWRGLHNGQRWRIVSRFHGSERFTYCKHILAGCNLVAS